MTRTQTDVDIDTMKLQQLVQDKARETTELKHWLPMLYEAAEDREEPFKITEIARVVIPYMQENTDWPDIRDWLNDDAEGKWSMIGRSTRDSDEILIGLEKTSDAIMLKLRFDIVDYPFIDLSGF